LGVRFILYSHLPLTSCIALSNALLKKRLVKDGKRDFIEEVAMAIDTGTTAERSGSGKERQDSRRTMGICNQ
jgi:hypothetical protein